MPPRAGAVASILEAARQFGIAIQHRWGEHPLGMKVIFVGLTAEMPTAVPVGHMARALSWQITPPEQTSKLTIDVYAVGDRASKVGSISWRAGALTETSMRNYALADRLTTYFLRTLLVLTAVALAGAVAAHAIGGCFAAAAFVVAYLGWALSEARITVGTPSQSAAENRTLVPYAAARVTTALAAAYAQPAVSEEVGVVLAGVFLAGATLRAWAIHELGAAYSHRVVPISESGLICSGP